MINKRINQKRKGSTHDFSWGALIGERTTGMRSGWSVCFDERTERGFRESELACQRAKGVVARSDMHLMIELVHEEVDVHAHVFLVLVGTRHLDDTSAFRSRVEKDTPVLVARPGAVLGDIHDLLGHATFAGGRVVQPGLVRLGDLEFFCHGFQFSYLGLEMCHRAEIARLLSRYKHSISIRTSQVQQKITISGVSHLLTSWIKKISSPKLKYGSNRCLVRRAGFEPA